jgi:hypothetical protein
MPTTFRTDTRAGIVTAATAFSAANPTMLRAVHAAKPTRYSGDIPFGYVELLTESIAHSSGLRMRTLSPSFVVVGRPLENDQSTGEFDALVDALVDHFTTYAHISPNTVWDEMTVSDESEEIQTADQSERIYPAVRFTFGNVLAREGRS